MHLHPIRVSTRSALADALRHLARALLDFAAWGALALVIGLIGQVLR